MNLIDALKSGRRFRRKNATLWWDTNPNAVYHFSREALISDDWEIEREPEVVECEFNYMPGNSLFHPRDRNRLYGKRWNAVFTEIID